MFGKWSISSTNMQALVPSIVHWSLVRETKLVSLLPTQQYPRNQDLLQGMLLQLLCRCEKYGC